jgi:hypothetical protein
MAVALRAPRDLGAVRAPADFVHRAAATIERALGHLTGHRRLRVLIWDINDVATECA